MLLLAGVDRLDKDLTIGQMQGRTRGEEVKPVVNVSTLPLSLICMLFPLQ